VSEIDDRAFVTVRYSCSLCGIKDREVKVRARENEDVVQWVKEICMVAVGGDHAAISPSCQATSVENLMIPISGADKVGGVVRQ
jgi:hypothetical protein